MENTTRENAVSEEQEAIQEMVDVVKEDAEVTVAYMKGFERDQMFLCSYGLSDIPVFWRKNI